MATTEKTANVFDDVLQNVRKATEATSKMQQDMLRQWTAVWPTFATPQGIWLDKVRDFQHQWTTTVSDLARKHREIVDRQYQSALESLEEALRVSEAKSPDELRQRVEHLCRKTIDCVREISETQLKELQNAVAKWSELASKAGA